MTDAASASPQDPVPYSFEPIAVIRSCYPDRFGIPRQSGLVPSAIAQIEFPNTDANRLALRGIGDFSHLWVLFVFHHQSYRGWNPLVKPPRLGGKKSVGVYATRSPNRLNPIGLSAVELSHVAMTSDAIALVIHGGDFLDQTPVLDVKPYLLYSDAIPSADSAWATQPQPLLEVQWSEQANKQRSAYSSSSDLKTLISETIALDPRPGYERGKDAIDGAKWYVTIAHVDVTWTVEQGVAIILQLQPCTKSQTKK